MLLMILVFLALSSVHSFPNKGYECPNCNDQHIKTVDPSTGKCVECWPCLECPDGTGSSVPCGATVPVGTKIHCVLCVNGANFSDNSGPDQCQPCGVCSGEHEHVLNQCTRESDVKCDCNAGFYRNKTNDKCLPCSSCPSCLRDKDIFPECQKDGSEKQMENSSTTMLSASVVSALVSSSHSHYATSTALLPGLTITKVLVPTRTQQISATSTSVLEHEVTASSKPTLQAQLGKQNVNFKKIKDDNTHESSSKKTVIIISVSFIMFVGFLIIRGGLLYHTKNSRSRQLNNDPVIFSVLNQGAIGEGNSVDELDKLDETHCSKIVQERNGSEPDLRSNQSTDSAHQDGRVIVSRVSHTAAIEAQKGIPSSLEGEQQGHNQPCDLPEDAQGGSVVASKDGTAVPSENMDMKNKMPSGNNTAVNVYVNFQDLSQVQRVTAAASPFAEFSSASCGNNLVIPVPSSGMIMPVNQGTTCAPSSIVAAAAQSTKGHRGYATHITNVPSQVIYKMCRLLDLDRELIDGNDFTRLGSELKLDSTTILNLKQKCDNPSFVLLMYKFPALPNSGTLGHLIPLLEKMERHDVIQVIDEWVDSQQCTEADQGN